MKLADSQSAFLRAADAIPSESWTRKPKPRQWSGAEVVAHLIMVEHAVVRSAEHVIAKPPKDVGFWEQAHLPLWLVETRFIRVQTPLALDPKMIADKEQMLGELRLTREDSVRFLAETQNQDLMAYGWPHVFLGRLNVYEWFEMIAGHQARHMKQIKDIARRLPKVVENSQIQ
ncbi:MAG: DinB family protein [Candidatus Acidiferrum sp.]